MSEDQANMIIKLLETFKEDNKEEHQGLVKRTDEIITHQKKTNGNVMDNTAYRLKFQGGFGVIKWVLGFLGVSNVAMIIKLFS